MTEIIGELLPPARLMMTPGPSCMDPRVYRAMSAPLVGHMDPWFIEMMNDVQVLLRRVFQTKNRVTYPVSASGSGGIEAAVLNPLEEGDECIVCVNGMFSERMAVIAERSPAKVIRVEGELGRTVDPEDVRRAGKGKKIKFVGLAQGETSTGVVQRLAEPRASTARWERGKPEGKPQGSTEGGREKAARPDRGSALSPARGSRSERVERTEQ